MPGPGDIAAMRDACLERPAANGPFGAKGIGEMTANAPIPAIANAIFDAVRRAARRRCRSRRSGCCAGWTSCAAATCLMRESTDLGAGGARRAASSYFADEGLLTAVHLALRSAARCCWRASRASARPRSPRCSRACSAAS